MHVNILLRILVYSWVIVSSVVANESVRDKKKSSPTWPPGRPKSGHSNIGSRPKRGGGHGYCRQTRLTHIFCIYFYNFTLYTYCFMCVLTGRFSRFVLRTEHNTDRQNCMGERWK